MIANEISLSPDHIEIIIEDTGVGFVYNENRNDLIKLEDDIIQKDKSVGMGFGLFLSNNIVK